MAQTLPTSAPPPSSAPPSGALAPEQVLEIEGARSWKRRRAVDYLKISPLGLELHHARVLRTPLVMPLGAVAVAVATASRDRSEPRTIAGEGRFPILRRLNANAVLPESEGIDGWLWTSTGGSAFPSLCEGDEVPNAALVFSQPLGEDVVARRFAPDFVNALATRSAHGVPAVYGLLLRVTDVPLAQTTFRKFGIAKPLTDREIPPTLRRSLPTDKPADPSVTGSTHARAAGSVAPPGLA
jgi:hypothetical protein